jgi:ribosome-binding protein aMBF1 (putative translation factor)
MREERLNQERRHDPLKYRGILIHKTLSDLICTQRKLHCPSLTQEELAFRSGISFEHLNRIENYRSTASIEVLDRIAKALGFKSVSEFLSSDRSGIL